MILHFDCGNRCKRRIICRCFWKSIIGNRKINNDVISFIYLIQWKKSQFLFKNGGVGGRTVRFLYAVNVVILIIFF